MSSYTYFFFVCKRLHFIKICLCCFLNIHLYSNRLSIIPTISMFILSELFPAFFSCSNNFNLWQSSLALSGRNTVEILETMMAGD